MSLKRKSTQIRVKNEHETNDVDWGGEYCMLISSMPTKFLRSFGRVDARVRAKYFTYMCTRNVLKYSDFIFYVATTKNNKFHFSSFLK